MLTRHRALTTAVLAVVVAGIAVLASPQRGVGRDQVSSLLISEKTILGQPIVYPTQTPAKVASAIVTMQAGEETGWHKHDVPMFGFILEGEVTVDYGAKGTRVYRQGEAVMEAINVAHKGRNTGSVPARILAVFMGADGVPNTVMLPQIAAPPPPPQ